MCILTVLMELCQWFPVLSSLVALESAASCNKINKVIGSRLLSVKLLFLSATSLVSSQLTHKVCRTFSEGFLKVRAVLTFWQRSGKVYHKVSVITMQNIFPHKTCSNLKYIKLKIVCNN